MKADLTRITYHPLKHYTRVVMQQGRVQLDADWNEQAAISLGYLRALAADLIGQHGGPADDLGFQLAGGASLRNDYALVPGHYYIDGILCELPGFAVAISRQSENSKQFSVPSNAAASFTNGQRLLLTATGQNMLTQVDQVNGNTITVADDITGILNNPNPKAYWKFITFLTQPDFPQAANTQILANASFYLDVWERLITYVQDDWIREVALNGPDTAARTKLVCQVKQWTAGGACIPPGTLAGTFQPPNRGLLKVVANQQTVSTDPCVIDPNSNYNGPENQLYRVEIHSGGVGTSGSPASGASPATFKWSRENGSVVYPIVTLSSTSTVTTVVLETLGRDDRFALTENDWVEIESDNLVLQNAASPAPAPNLLQVQAIDASSLTANLTGAPPSNFDLTKHPLVRRWDQSFGNSTPAQGGLTQGSDMAALIVEDAWLTLENGIQIQFQSNPSGNIYRTGDYWLIPARTATGSVEWPNVTTKDPTSGKVTTSPAALPPDGVDHHYAPLAAIGPNGLISCQNSFQPLAKPVGAAP